MASTSPSVKLIKSSDGSANASLATVQATRAMGATTIEVDTISGFPTNFYGSMGTPHTFTDPVTNEEIVIISEATAVDFEGHIDVSDIEIDAIAPGYTDNGSEVGDVVVIRPITEWANNIARLFNVAHNDDGTIKDDAINDEDQFTDSLSPVVRAVDNVFDHVASGVVLAGTGYGSTLAWSLSAGVVYINGKRLTYAGDTGNVTATKDTYFDLLDNGDGTAVLVNTGGNIVTVNAASPALAANSIRVGIIQSGANIASVAAINQGQEGKVLPIASSVPYMVTDSLGNLICPRDSSRKLLGYRQLIADSSGLTSATFADLTGMAFSINVPTGRKIRLVFNIGNKTNSASGVLGVRIQESTTVLQDGQFFAGGTSIVNAKARDAVTLSPTAGVHTYKLTVNNALATGNVVVASAATFPSAFWAELI